MVRCRGRSAGFPAGTQLRREPAVLSANDQAATAGAGTLKTRGGSLRAGADTGGSPRDLSPQSETSCERTLMPLQSCGVDHRRPGQRREELFETKILLRLLRNSRGPPGIRYV
jgi:hypothetical protein